MKHLHIFGIRIIIREGVIEVALHGDNLCPDSCEDLFGKGASCPVAAGRDDFNLVFEFEAFGQVESTKIIKDGYTGRSRGFGFVEMPSKEEGA